jgi:hypothetical protein
MSVKTPIAAAHLGIEPKALIAMIRCRRIVAPLRDSSGDFLWSAKDLANVRRALRVDRRRKQHRGASYV